MMAVLGTLLFVVRRSGLSPRIAAATAAPTSPQRRRAATSLAKLAEVSPAKLAGEEIAAVE